MGHGEQQQQGQAGGAGIRRHQANLELSPSLKGEKASGTAEGPIMQKLAIRSP
jgi:hypothetical protein